ncbi:MAG: M28 family peptidase [Acidobacteriota bacterium]|nr:M28 family peptidase [Acidobacteriota bacterium]
MRRGAWLRTAIVLAAAFILRAADLSPDEYLGYVKYLSSDSLKGRATGTPELDKAADYIASKFRGFGLQPLHGSSYYQDFVVTTSARLGRHNSLVVPAVRGAARLRTSFKLQRDYIPLNLSARGRVSGQVVFAGYGITAPEYRYDDYAGLDVKGKLVLVLQHEPQEFDAKSVFEGKSSTSHSTIFSKAANAKMHGAKAILLVNDVAAHPNEDDRLEKFGTTIGPGNCGIPAVQVRAEIASAWLALGGKKLMDIEADIDRSLQSESFALPDALRVNVNADVQRETKTVHNVGAYLPGESDEYVIVGAHYDHLGLGGQFSLAPALAGTIHPGADDNASGTAGVLELGHMLAPGPKHRRGVLFLTFAGEELGLLGSEYYVNHPELPLNKAVAMINMDMIGRIREEKVFISGAGTGTTLDEILKSAAKRHPFHTDFSEQGGYGASDHTSFTGQKVPVLFFFSGLHSDYHKPSDTWDKIDAPQAVKLLGYIGDVIGQLEDAAERPQFVRVAAPHGNGDHSGVSTGSGYGPDFGSIPDFTELPNGVRFADVRPNSPANKAGLEAGDILTEFDGKPIQNLYDFTYALRARKPGDQVLVKVLRGHQTIEAKVLLTERK